MDARPSLFISVLTPTHNRGSLLARVRASLGAQTDKDFEWIVADDGSTDDTLSIVRSLAEDADFPVLLIRSSAHVGKVRMDNEAIRRARGTFVLWCDSDDYLLPGAIARLREAWESIPGPEREQYVGVTALCTTGAGLTANPFPQAVYTDVSWNDLAEIHRVPGDMLYMAKTADLQASPFPEVDLVVPESVVWTALGHRRTRMLSEPLKMVEYRAEDGISFSGVMAYNRGRAVALASTCRNLKGYRRAWTTRWWRQITFLRYCWHGEIGLREACRLWRGNAPAVILLLSAPIAWLLAGRDAARGKVRKTHRQFLAARAATAISVDTLGRC